jgi:hypothetical protein
MNLLQLRVAVVKAYMILVLKLNGGRFRIKYWMGVSWDQ